MKPSLTPLFQHSHHRFPPSLSTEYSQEPPSHLTTPETPSSTAYPSSNLSSTFQIPPSPKSKRHSISKSKSRFNPSNYIHTHTNYQKPSTTSKSTNYKSHNCLTLPLFPLNLNLNPFRIHSTTRPKPTWSSTQCQTWLTAILIDHCGRDKESARRTAQMVFQEGGYAAGPGLLLMSRETWGRGLGRGDGDVVWGVLEGWRGRGRA